MSGGWYSIRRRLRRVKATLFRSIRNRIPMPIRSCGAVRLRHPNSFSIQCRYPCISRGRCFQHTHGILMEWSIGPDSERPEGRPGLSSRVELPYWLFSTNQMPGSIFWRPEGGLSGSCGLRGHRAGLTFCMICREVLKSRMRRFVVHSSSLCLGRPAAGRRPASGISIGAHDPRLGKDTDNNSFRCG